MKYLKYFLQFLVLSIFCNEINAQVPVIEEPHHKPVLINDYVRLLDVHLNAGDTTFYHIHAAPSVIVMISNSVIGMQKSGEAPSASSQVFAGQTSFMAYGEHPITHRVYNSGNNVFHVMDIELAKNAPSPDSCAALQQNNIQTTINEKLVRVYKFELNSIQSINIAKSSCAHLLICISGEISTTGKKIKTGEYIFFNPDTEISLSNQQKGSSNCVLLEIK
jgi:hypothetical protein